MLKSLQILNVKFSIKRPLTMAFILSIFFPAVYASPDSAEEVAEHYIAAMHAGHWKEAFLLFAPEELEPLKRSGISHKEHPEVHRRYTSDFEIYLDNLKDRKISEITGADIIAEMFSQRVVAGVNCQGTSRLIGKIPVSPDQVVFVADIAFCDESEPVNTISPLFLNLINGRWQLTGNSKLLKAFNF